jgi:Zn-dependent alcohol dehydrogenase
MRYTHLMWRSSSISSAELMYVQVIREMTDGGVDYSFECTGINDVLREAFVSTHDVRCTHSLTGRLAMALVQHIWPNQAQHY